ncbi:hypothetical protein PENTCL1PPCAC_19266, partial [Pristionchus entomophagus]
MLGKRRLKFSPCSHWLTFIFFCDDLLRLRIIARLTAADAKVLELLRGESALGEGEMLLEISDGDGELSAVSKTLLVALIDARFMLGEFSLEFVSQSLSISFFSHWHWRSLSLSRRCWCCLRAIDFLQIVHLLFLDRMKTHRYRIRSISPSRKLPWVNILGLDSCEVFSVDYCTPWLICRQERYIAENNQSFLFAGNSNVAS